MDANENLHLTWGVVQMGIAVLMNNNMVKPEVMPGFVSRIRNESARLLALIEGILCLSRIDEG